jgi:hypothetical protein
MEINHYSLEQLKDLAIVAELFDYPNLDAIQSEISRKEALYREDYFIARAINFDLFCQNMPNDYEQLKRKGPK